MATKLTKITIVTKKPKRARKLSKAKAAAIAPVAVASSPLFVCKTCDLPGVTAATVVATCFRCTNKPKTAAEKYVNNTSRLRKWVCDCDEHVVNVDTGRTAVGPYILRVPGSVDLVATCGYCKTLWVLEDVAATGRLYRGCAHCTNPNAHDHGPIGAEGEVV